MKCTNCNQDKPIFKIVEGTKSINGSLTKRNHKRARWCQECWEANVQLCEQQDSFNELAAITVQEIIRTPGLKEKLVQMGPDDDVFEGLIAAMAESSVNRFDKFATRIHTNEKLRCEFRRLVLALARAV